MQTFPARREVICIFVAVARRVFLDPMYKTRHLLLLARRDRRGRSKQNHTRPGKHSGPGPQRASECRGRRGRTKKHTTGPQHWCFAAPGLFRPGLVDQALLVIGSSGSSRPEQKSPGSIAAARRPSRAVFLFAPAPPSPARP